MPRCCGAAHGSILGGNLRTTYFVDGDGCAEQLTGDGGTICRGDWPIFRGKSNEIIRFFMLSVRRICDKSIDLLDLGD